MTFLPITQIDDPVIIRCNIKTVSSVEDIQAILIEPIIWRLELERDLERNFDQVKASRDIGIASHLIDYDTSTSFNK